MTFVGSHTIRAGEEIVFHNPNSVAITYRLDFGAAGSVRIVMPPGADFTLIGGAVAVAVNIESTSEPGMRLLDPLDDPDG